MFQRRNSYYNILILLVLSIFIISACSDPHSENQEENIHQEKLKENGNNDNNEEIAENKTTNSKEENEEYHQLIATTVALVEMMDALELDLVGVPTSYKELPERYDEAIEVGMAAEPDMEIIKSLDPDEVLSVTTLDAEYDLKPVFGNANIPVTFYDLEGIDNMYDSIDQIAKKYDRIEQADQLIDEFDEKVEEIDQIVENKESPKVLILLGVPGSYLVATENSYLGDVVERAGGKNVFPGEDGREYIAANTEHLLQVEPDIILRAAHGMPEEVVKMFDEEFMENDIWKHFKAVENGEVYDLEETLFGTTANLAVIEALDHLVELFYSDQ